jgi:hypothetical protein
MVFLPLGRLIVLIRYYHLPHRARHRQSLCGWWLSHVLREAGAVPAGPRLLQSD